ncbi:MAG: YkuS family protein [Firmicutes bacterium]|nr:YkuS family protein [Bacillota bacterium]
MDESLTNIRQALESQGYQVLDLDSRFQDADVVVISGMAKNRFGDQTIDTEAHIIDASGLSADQVVNEVEKALKIRH